MCPEECAWQAFVGSQPPGRSRARPGELSGRSASTFPSPDSLHSRFATMLRLLRSHRCSFQRPHVSNSLTAPLRCRSGTCLSARSLSANPFALTTSFRSYGYFSLFQDSLRRPIVALNPSRATSTVLRTSRPQASFEAEWYFLTVYGFYSSRKAPLLNTVDKGKCLGDPTLFQASRESLPSQQG